jgi:hypothetical protein
MKKNKPSSASICKFGRKKSGKKGCKKKPGVKKSNTV